MEKHHGNFVGRKAELDILRETLKNPKGEKRILFILGGGGIGKTLLVKEMLKEAQKAKILAPEELIDLFSTDYRHIDGIQWKIKEIVENLPALKGQPSPFADFVRGKTDTSEKFYECLKKFCAIHPLVLAFDTFENLDKVASDWMFKGEEGGLQVEGLVCIVAGRYEKDNLETYRKNPLVKEILLSGLALEEANQFYQRIANEFVDPLIGEAGLERVDSTQNSLEWIWKITEGRPLRMEMVFRWSGTLLNEKNITDLTADKFEEQLMAQVRELGERGLLDVGPLKVSQPVYDTLICMAYVTRRFDEHFLSYLIDRKLIRLEEPNASEKDILENLEKYFFVKLRTGSATEPVIQLHDEMAHLVREYVWRFLDNSGEKKQALLEAVDQYYDQLISEKAKGREETDILQIEQLFYTLQQDPELGKELWFNLAELGNANINKLLPGEMKGYIAGYNPITQYALNCKVAEIEKDAQHFNQSIAYWENARQLGETQGRVDWVVDTLLGKFNASWHVDPGKALKDYLEPAKELAERRVPEKIARVYYETGFAYRQMQDMEKAIEWYEKGLREFRERPQDELLEATLRNDSGYAYAQLGRWGEATKYLNAALAIRAEALQTATGQLENGRGDDTGALGRRHSRLAMHVGRSQNTLGEFYRHTEDLGEALTHYLEACRIFEKEKNYYWQAKALGGRGETYRRLALQAKVQGNQHAYDKYVGMAREDMTASLYLCEKYQLDDERDTAHRRLGRLLHDFAINIYDRGDKNAAREHLENAYDEFKRGIEYARKTGEILEEFENLTEQAFLLDDAIVIFAPENVPSHYRKTLPELEKALKAYRKNKPHIHQFPVFEALLKLEHGAVAFENGKYEQALKDYLAGYKKLGSLQGYGVARYKQHFAHLTRQIKRLPKESQPWWCREFIEVWKKTPSGRPGKTLADDLIPDLVKWCNRLLSDISNEKI